MLCKNLLNRGRGCPIIVRRSLHKSAKYFVRKDKSDYEHPFRRTFRILCDDVVNAFKVSTEGPKALIPRNEIPSHSDVVIIGGGAIGSSIAYWLKEKTNPDSFHITVIEKDPTYAKSSTALSVGGLRQQFSLPENIQMSLFGADFIRDLKKRLGPKGDVSFTPHGYLVLATEEGAQQLIENSELQNDLGAVNVILRKNQIKERFPWMNVDDVELGCLGLEKEGWFDPWSLLQIMKNGAEEKMTQYVHAEVVGFNFEDRHDMYIEGVGSRIKKPLEVVVQTPNGERKSIQYALCIVAAGADSGEIAKALDMGTGDGILSIGLPVERRKRYVYVVNCEKDPPGLNAPMTIDHTGAYFRRDGLGGKFICGISPDEANEPDTSNLDVNYEFFDKHLWPVLANRVPAFNALKVSGAWSGFYDYNAFDENGIIGPHPYYDNLFLATGFSGHGIQQAPAVGRAIAELILDGRFQTIDLTRFGFDRLLLEKRLLEARII